MHKNMCYRLACVHFYHGAWDGHCSAGFLIEATRHLRRKVLWRKGRKSKDLVSNLDWDHLVLTKDEMGPLKRICAHLSTGQDET